MAGILSSLSSPRAINPLFQDPMQVAIQQEAAAQGIELPQTGGEAARTTPLLSTAEFGQALSALGASLGQAQKQGYGLGAGLAVGGGAFSGAVQGQQDRVRQAERQATQDQLAYLKDISGLRLNKHNADLQDQQFEYTKTSGDRNYDLAKSGQAADIAARNAQLGISRGQLGVSQAEFDLKKQQAESQRASITQLRAANPQLANLPDEAVLKIAVNAAEKANTPPTEAQANSGTFANRVNTSNGQIEQYTTALTGFKGAGNNLLNAIPGVGNALIDKDYQAADQASRNFINAVLRRESGAAISPSEFQNAYIQYLPRPGDSEQTLANKKLNREQVLGGLQRGAGPSFQMDQMPNAAAGSSDPLGVRGGK